MSPISVIDNKPARKTREISVRPLKQSGIDLFKYWLDNQPWENVLKAETVDQKAENFQNLLLKKLEKTKST